jgi:hypothetical protein
MDDYGASTYGDRVADVYDEMVLGMGLDTEGTVEFLAERAGQGPALELAIGTGRIALPLSERDQMHSIDASGRWSHGCAKPERRHPVTIGTAGRRRRQSTG